MWVLKLVLDTGNALQFIVWNVQFTTVPFKHVSNQVGERYIFLIANIDYFKLRPNLRSINPQITFQRNHT